MPTTPHRDLLVLKIGGSIRDDAEAATAAIVALVDAGYSLVVVHGGGPLIGEWTQRMGLESRFIGGMRVTDEPTRDVVLAVLAGLVNARMVAALVARGVPAVGLCGVDGGMLRAERDNSALGLVGEFVSRVDSALLEDLLAAGHIPVIAPAAIEDSPEDDMGPVDNILNVNADTAAGAIAASIGARLLVLVTDVPGVRRKDGRLITTLDVSQAKALIEDGTIEGGMLPKVEACLIAAAAGCRSAIVGGGGAETIERLLAGEQVGTVFEAAA